MGAGTDRPVAALAVFGSDLYVGGSFTTAGGIAANGIAKWDGTAWSAVGEVPWFSNTEIYAFAISGGDLYVAGRFVEMFGHFEHRVQRWNGSAWRSLNLGAFGISGRVSCLAAIGGDLYAGGEFKSVGEVSAKYVAKWDGSSWSALGSGMDDPVTALAVSGSDLYAGGWFRTAGGLSANYVAKWNGSSWSALGSGANGPVGALAVSGPGLYVGGSFAQAGGEGAYRVAKWNSSGWSPLGSGINGPVNALAVLGSDLYLGGHFTKIGGINANYVVRWNGNGWSAVGGGMNGPVRALEVSGTNLYAGGFFTNAGGITANLAAKWDGARWSALGGGIGMDPALGQPYSAVAALAVSETNLYAGGSFGSAGGVAANSVAKWDGTSWSALGPGVNGSVYALAVSGTNLYVGGYFHTVDGNAVGVARWDGINWSALGSGISGGYGRVHALALLNSDLYVGGSFTSAGGVSAINIAKWDGNTWTALAEGLSGPAAVPYHGGVVSALTLSGSDLYAGGLFNSPANSIAKWDGSKWSALGAGVSGPRDDQGGVSALAALGNNLYVGGRFYKVGGKGSPFIARARLVGEPSQTYLLTDYHYPPYSGNQWTYDSRESGSSWSTTCRILSAAFPLDCYSNCSPVVPFTRDTIPVLFDQGGGTAWTNYMHVEDPGFGYVGFDHVEGSRLRFGPRFIFTNRFAVGQTVTVTDEVYSGGVCSGQGMQSIQLLGLADVTVPYGSFSGCLHLMISNNILGSARVEEHWWAKGVGPVKWTRSGGGDSETNELRAASFGSPVAAWEGSDDFASGISMDKWTVNQTNTGQMTVEGANNHASFLVPSSSTDSQSAYITWRGTPTAAEDWAVGITGQASAGYSMNGDSALQCAVYRTTSVGGSLEGYRIAMVVEKDASGALMFNVKQRINGDDQLRAETSRPSGLSAMRLVYYSASGIIEAWYDPGASGRGWTKLDAISLAEFSPSMTPSDTFTLAVLGNTYFGPISEGEIWADDFRITSPGLVPLRFASNTLATNGVFQAQLTGPTNANVILQSSFNLTQWTPVSTNTITAGGLLLTWPTGTATQQFFRARLWP